MRFDLESGIHKAEGLPDLLRDALLKAAGIFRSGIPYTDKRNEFAASIVSSSSGQIYSGGNFLSINADGKVESKECAEGTALAMARSIEGPEFQLGAVVILNRVVEEDGEVNGQRFGPCDRCQSSLIALTISIADRRKSKTVGELQLPDDQVLKRIPVISGVFDPASAAGCDEVLVASLLELSTGDSICYDTRHTDSAIPLRIQHVDPQPPS